MARPVGTPNLQLTAFRVVRFILSLGLAVGLWLLTQLSRPYDTTLRVPVTYTSLPAGVKLIKPLPKELILTVHGSGLKLLGYKMGLNLDTLQVNLADAMGARYMVTQRLQPQVSAQFPTFSVKYIDPDTLRLEIDPLVAKKLAVSIGVRLEPASGYRVVGLLQPQPDSVLATGTAAELASLVSWPTEQLTWPGLTQPDIRPVALQSDPAVQITPSHINLGYEVVRYTEARLRIPLRALGLPPGYSLRMTPHEVEVVCWVPFDRYAELTPDDFDAVIDLRGASDQQYLVAPALARRPRWVENVQLLPEAIIYVRSRTL